MRILGFPGQEPVTTTNSFSTIQPDFGTSPVATSPTDTLTFTSSDGSVTITGNSATDTINFQVASTQLDASFLTLGTDAQLPNERVFTPGSSLSASDGGAGAAYLLNTIQDIRTSASPTFTGLTLSGLTQGSVIFAGSGGVLSQDNTNLFWDDSGNSLITGDPGTEASGINLDGTTYNSRLKISDIGGTTPAQIIIHRHSTTIPSAIVASRSNSDTSAHGSVTAGQILFELVGAGWTGSHYDSFGVMYFATDQTGSISSTSSPGAWYVLLTPDGSNTPAGVIEAHNTGIVGFSQYGTGIAHFSSAGLISSSLIVNADVSASAAIDFSKLAALTSANILVGNGSNVATAVAVTGDISLTNAGVTAYAGTVPVNKGGTNLTSYTSGDLIYAIGGTTLSKLAIGASTRILTSSGTDPQWSTVATVAGTLDHNSLLNLTTGDVHTQYAFLAGRSGGQGLTGGTDANDSLYLESTSNGTKGGIFIESGTYTITGTSSSVFVAPTLTWNGTGAFHTVIDVFTQGTITQSSNLAGSLVFWYEPTLTLDPAVGNKNFGAHRLGFLTPTYKANTGNITGGNLFGLDIAPTFDRIVGTETITWNNIRGIYLSGIANNISTGLTVTNVVGTLMTDQGSRVTNAIGLDFQSQTSNTLSAAVRSANSSGTGKWCILSTGTADSAHTGQLRLGDTTAPTALLDIKGLAKFDTNGMCTVYEGLTLTGNGLPHQVATVDLTAQGAAIGATTIYAVPASGAGRYRITFIATVTRAATTSSTLGGTAGYQVIYTDNDDSVVKTTAAAGAPAAGTNQAYSQTNQGNSTASTITGVILVNAKASTNIQHSIGYTSAGATSMQYNLHVIVERM